MVIILVALNTPSFPKTHTWTNPSNTYTHLQLAHPVLPMLSAFWSRIWKSQFTQTCVSCQLWSIGGSICGGRNEKKSGEGWQERGGGLKGEREKHRGSLIQKILDPPLCREWYFMKHTDNGSVEEVTLNSPFDHPEAFVSVGSLHILSFLCQCSKLGMISVCV